MKKHISFYLFLLFFAVACGGQKNNKIDSKPKVTEKTTSIPFISPLPKHDPYFIETSAVNSPNGPASITRNILQDQHDNMWFASWEGIIKYDGSTFVNYTNKEGLRRFHVFSVLEDLDGIIWFGTIGAGVYRYDADAKGDKFINYTTHDGLASDRVTCFFQDESGAVWIGTDRGISVYNKESEDSTKELFKNYTIKNGLPDDDINSIIKDKDGRMWFGARGQACYFEDNKFTKFTDEIGTPFINVRSIIEDRQGVIWLGGNNGLWSYKKPKGADQNSIGSFTQHATNFVGYIYEDRKGVIWISAVGDNPSQWELLRYDRLPAPAKDFNVSSVKTENGQLFGIVEAKDGAIWVGHERGVCRYADDNKGTANSFNCFVE